MTNQDYRPPIGTAVDEASLTEPQRELIKGLEAWLVFLKTTRNFPAKQHYYVNHQTGVNSVEEVDEAAKILGVTAEWNDRHTHYEACKEFGPVRYFVLYITPAYMAARCAAATYSSSVEPDGCHD